MTILHQKKVRLVNDEISRRNPDSSSGIYLTAAKVAQCTLVDENRREKEEAKKEKEGRQKPKSCIFNKYDLKLFRNTKTP